MVPETACSPASAFLLAFAERSKSRGELSVAGRPEMVPVPARGYVCDLRCKAGGEWVRPAPAIDQIVVTFGRHSYISYLEGEAARFLHTSSKIGRAVLSTH